jgi:hypothetical protein
MARFHVSKTTTMNHQRFLFNYFGGLSLVAGGNIDRYEGGSSFCWDRKSVPIPGICGGMLYVGVL